MKREQQDHILIYCLKSVSTLGFCQAKWCVFGIYMMKTKAVSVVWCLVGLVFCIGANAATCQKTGETCIDTTPSKVISGVTITLSEAGGCWQYQDTYTCIEPNAVNYCQPFINAAPACWQTSSQCAPGQMDTTFGTGCMQYTQTYQCGNGAMPTAPTNTVKLADTYTLVSTGYDTSQCPSANSNNCSIASSNCTSTTSSPPLPPGISPSVAAPDGCYQQTNTYACTDGTSSSDCGQYSSNPNCSLQSTNNTNTLPNGTVTVQQQTYNCMTTPPQTKTTMDCSGTTFCQGGNCFNTGHPSDNAFATATAIMEAGREGGVYNQNGVIFSGVDESCRIRLFGAKNCCKTKGGGAGYSNNAVMGAALQVGGETLAYGSKYMFDTLYQDSPTMLSTAFTAMTGVYGGSVSALSFQPSANLYGVSISYTGFAGGAGVVSGTISAAATAAGADAAAAATAYGASAGAVAAASQSATAAYSAVMANAATLTGDSAMTVSAATDLASQAAAAAGETTATMGTSIFSDLAASYNAATVSTTIGNFTFAFNPYMLAAMVVVQVIEDLTSCNTSEQMLDMKRGQNLCTYVGTYCSQELNLLVTKICVEHTETFCCYNSLLAKIIEEQGRNQIGKGYGSTQSPDCSGLTTAQFQQIDFSKIDLSQFTSQIMASVNVNNAPGANSGVSQNAQNLINQQIQNYYTTGSQYTGKSGQ